MSVKYLLIIPLLLGAEKVAKPLPKPDDQIFQGEWKVLALTTDGKPAAAAELKNARFKVDGNKYAYQSGESFEGTFTLIATAMPRQINSTLVDKEEAETGVARGIYKFDGMRLTICWAEVGSKARPTGFVSEPNSKTRLIVLEKVKVEEKE